MRALLFLILITGCEASRDLPDGARSLDGFFGVDEDLSVPSDLAAADLRGLDLAGLDLAGADLQPPADLAQSNADLALPPPDGSGTITPGATCATAPTLVAGLLYPDQDTTSMGDDYHIGYLSGSMTCNKNDNVYKEPDVAYAISVPNGKTLTVQVTPSNLPTRWDPALAIVEDCANGATCLAGHDESDPNANPETVSWTNNTGAAKSVFVIVDSYYHSPGVDGYGKFSIQAVLQ